MKHFPLKRILAIGSFCLAMALPMPISAYNGLITEENITYQTSGALYQKQEVEKIAQGVDHIKISKLTVNGWVDIHVLKAQMNYSGLALTSLRSDQWKKKETLMDMAQKSSLPVLGAVNASYFGVAGTYSDSQGFEYDQGLVNIDNLLRPGLFEDLSGKLFFSHAQSLSIIEGETGRDLNIPVKAANNLPGTEGVAIYNNKVYSSSQEIDKMGEYYKVNVKNGRVEEIVAPYLSTDFSPEGYTLVFPATMSIYLQDLTKGKAIQIKTESGIALNWLKLAVPGGAYVLQNGQLSTTGELVQPGRRHPRTALGVNANQDTLYMVVIDGRGTSIGATHYELAQYLQDLGVTDAISMDGGGSSILLARNLGDKGLNIENDVSNKHQRKLINGLAVVSTQETGPAAHLIVTANSKKTFANMPIKLEVRAVDANQMPVAVDPSQVTWRVSGAKARVENQELWASEVGRVEVTAYWGDLHAKLMVEVTGNPIDLEVVPSILEVSKGKAGFQLLGTDASGFVGPISPKDATYKLEDETVGYFADGLFIPSKKGGNTRVTISVGQRSAVAYLVGGHIEQDLPGFLTTPLAYNLQGRVDASVTLENGFGFQDRTSMSFAYLFHAQTNKEEGGNNSRQKIEMRYTSPLLIENEPENLSLQVYGNQGLLRLTADIRDSQDNKYQVALASGTLWDGWKKVDWKLPRELAYPVELLGFSLENLEGLQDQAGQIYLDDFKYVAKNAFPTTNYQELPLDRLRQSFSRQPDISLFGATGGRNRILDSVILDKALAHVQKAKVGIYGGWTDLPAHSQRPGDYVWQNAYSVYDTDQVRIINLGSRKGSFKNLDSSQFARLSADLANTVVNNIIIVADIHPLEEVKNKREAELVHDLISRYGQSSGKNIFYVVASGYHTDVKIRDGVRYIRTNGLWYQIRQGREIDLNRMFYSVDFYLENNNLYYDIKNLYPLVE